MINTSLRSATNGFHGAAWEFLRNPQPKAVGFFKPATVVKPVPVQNQFGAAFGGRLIRHKAFFFVNYEGFRRVERTLPYASIPTLGQRAGPLGGPVRNPLTGELHTDGVIPQPAITPFARNDTGRRELMHTPAFLLRDGGGEWMARMDGKDRWQGWMARNRIYLVAHQARWPW